MIGNQLQNISIEALRPNDENETFTMNDIDILVDSIREHGLLTPLTVYFSDQDHSKYTILSGHRRFEACKQLGMTSVPVQVVDSPKDRIAEFESICEANIARNSEEDKEIMIKNAADFWEELGEKDKAVITEKLKERYMKRIGNLDAFKPRNEYVRAITGITISDSTIIRKLNDMKTTPEQKEAKKTNTKKKTRSFSKFCHDNIYELEYKLSENTDEELPMEVQEAIAQLIDIMRVYADYDNY